MDNDKDPQNQQRQFLEDDSLETPASSPDAIDARPLDPNSAPASVQSSKPSIIRRLLGHGNIYLLAFIGLLLLAGVVVTVAILTNRKSDTTTLTNQPLTKQTLEQLADSDVSVGQPKQILNVQSNAVFAGQVLIRSNLDVAGKLQVGGGLDLPDVSVSGTGLFATAQVQKNLSVAGDSSLQGQLSVQKGLTVAGGANFGGAVSIGQLNAGNLQLGGDLAISRHIVTNGSTPGRSGGPALGSGGSASVSGSDTAGTVNVNTGSGAGSGCFVTVTFTQKYAATPHVIVSPVGSGAAGSGYYVNRNATSFSICANTPPSGASFAFDYFVAG